MTNSYHAEDRVEEALRGLVLRGEAEGSKHTEVLAVADAGWEGRLSEAQFQRVNARLACARRNFYASAVSWAVYTSEYQASLKRLVQVLAGKDKVRVLEVCAGRGVLARTMASDVEWLCTDSEPAEGHVWAADALEAVEELSEHFDVLFVSWVPYESTLDYELAAKWCGELGKPMILVGEGGGGCTGSQEFWGWTSDPEGESWHETVDFEVPYERVLPGKLVAGFEDVPCWEGLSDFTVVALPKRDSE